MVTIYQDMPLIEREKQLQNLAVKTEKRNYSRSLDQSEIDSERNKYTNNAIDLEKLESELDNLKKDYTAKLKAMEEAMKERLEKIKTGKQMVSGNLYGLANHENGRMMFYDKYGELIDSRDLLPEEKQGRMNFIGPPKAKGEEIAFEEVNDGDGKKVKGTKAKPKDEQQDGVNTETQSIDNVMEENAKKNSRKRK